MNDSMFILFTGLLYTVLYGLLAWMRREGLSRRFAIEATLLTLAAAGISYATGIWLHPVLFLLGLYLITMRVRLLSDLGTFFAKQRQLARAESTFRLAGRLWPDPSGASILQLNQGVLYIQQGKLDQAIANFRAVLEKNGQGSLGIKYEAAAHYNLGIAYRKKQMDAQARTEFNAVLETWPASEYGRRATRELEGRR
jgi:tetratricopeptide (TPR) repeat protein